MKVRTVERPYVLTFDYAQSGAYPLSSAEAQRLIDAYPVVKATANCVTLLTDQPDRMKSFLRPATLGGEPAFEVER